MTAIGVVHSCFREKFGIPRQPGLVTEAKAKVEIYEPYNRPEAFEGLEQCSHIWLEFVFHQTVLNQWKPKVRPPRLGGNKSMGVFATRSPVRPNRIGLSVVKLEAMHMESGGVVLEVSGIDLLGGTPVLDIKPYVPYADAVESATNTFAEHAPAFLPVEFDSAVSRFCINYAERTGVNVSLLVEQVLQQDPRPQYHALDLEREYAMKLLDLDIKWRYQTIGDTSKILVTGVETL